MEGARKMISVIIPVYNGAEHIDNIYASFKKQSYTAFELIFINDGSTDVTLSKLNDLVTKNNLNIKYITQERGGVSTARNKGLSIASGDFICFCDVDDEVKPGYLKDMLDWMEYEDIDLVFSRNELMKNNIVVTPDYTGDTFIMPREIALVEFLYGKIDTTCCALMVRKELLLVNDLRFADGYKYGEDLHMMWQLIGCSNNIAYVDKPLYIYKLQPGSAMSVFNKDRFHAYHLMVELEPFFMKEQNSFSRLFKKYAANKVMWSITWQRSTYLSNYEFKTFIRKYQIKKKMLKLLTFKNRKVAISALLCVTSPALFRRIAIWFGRKYIH